MEECIFCNIVNGKIPAFKVYEDDTFLAFMDIFPRVMGHTLVIPKKHHRWTYDVPEFGAYWEVVKKVSMAVKDAVNAGYISYVTVGEAVPHAHVHILPQEERKIDGIRFTEVKSIEKEEIKKISEKAASLLLK
jgi:histidine triad (HIT) family protein